MARLKSVNPWYSWLLGVGGVGGRGRSLTPHTPHTPHTQKASYMRALRLTSVPFIIGRDNPELPATLAFCELQQQCLSNLAPTIDGKTQKQKNPYPLNSLPRTTWIMQRLGGWSGYSSQKPPGITTLVRGLYELESTFFVWKLALDILVCTP
ncbi:MAG: hypothetical protein RM049_36590 [Nostoc sp. DedQUE04]|uniref:hypothetical protein n=1 Tax=Nostoc sp. DedQUE04 TaxID=3075390 RepID=UPI002AD482BB|nr:hypothetical protein [Nostoc sp. DedQUE04]MDZ8140751.1 hypothetical protein [Nostoc sp. DedQUE04]